MGGFGGVQGKGGWCKYLGYGLWNALAITEIYYETGLRGFGLELPPGGRCPEHIVVEFEVPIEVLLRLSHIPKGDQIAKDIVPNPSSQFPCLPCPSVVRRSRESSERNATPNKHLPFPSTHTDSQAK